MPPRFPGTVTPTPSEDDIDTFCAAARDGEIQTVTSYLDRFGKAIIDRRDTRQDTALTWAAWKGDTEMVRLLLDRGASIDATGMTDRTALGWAANGNHRDVVEILLARGADANIRDADGNLPADLADNHHQDDLGSYIRAEAERRDRAAAEKAAQKREEEKGKELAAKRLEELRRHKPPKLKL